MGREHRYTGGGGGGLAGCLGGIGRVFGGDW